MILAFAHPAIVVSDLEVAREFYEKMFGFRKICDEGWHDHPTVNKAIGTTGSVCKGYMLAGHNCCLELFEFSAPSQSQQLPCAPHEHGIRHLSFYVDDCFKELDRLLALGGSTLGEPADLGDGVHAVYCRDPFGNIVELCQFASEEEHPVNLRGIDRLDDYEGSSE